MSQWLGAAKLFEESSQNGSFFEAQSSVYALKQIHSTLNDTFPQMIFLLGEPGSGKSFLLNYLTKYYKGKKECLVVGNPYLTPIELLNRMLLFAKDEPKSQDVETLREQAINAYRDKEHIIMIDEAQLTHPPLREFIRILSDSKVFWFLIAMHTKEGESLLRSTHFYSRPHKVIYMGDLQAHECQPYLQKTLQGSQMWDFVIGMGAKLVQKSWEYAKGNFRNFKKLYYHLFLLLDYANENNKKEFIKPSAKLLKMAAIKAGLVADKKGIEDFDELVQSASSSRASSALKVASGILLFLALGASGWYFKEYLPFKIISKTTPQKSETNGTIALHVKQKEIKQNEKTSQERVVLAKEKEKSAPLEAEEKPLATSKQLEFYPPNYDPSVVVSRPKATKPKPRVKVLPLPKEEEIVVEYEALIEQEPIFLDDEVEAEKSAAKSAVKRGPILQVSSAKPKDVKALVNHFLKSPTYKDALKIANVYYDRKDYKNATSWAKKANQLDREQEEAWILFAKSQYESGNKKDAKAVLKLFLDYKASQKAKLLLDKWES